MFGEFGEKNNLMDCQKAKQLIPSYLALQEPWDESSSKGDLMAHIAMCESCRQEYEETREIVRLFQKYGLNSEDNTVISRQGAKTPREREINIVNSLRLLNLSEHRERARETHFSANLYHTDSSPKVKPQITKRVASIAAAIIVCIGLGFLFQVSSNTQTKQVVQQSPPSSLNAIPVVTITENGVAVSASEPITTDANIRRLLINHKHEVVVNHHTSLLISPLSSGGELGCLVNLQSGQILAHVEHDGKPFEVHTLQGKAVITGTVFDIQVTEDETILVVAEGEVWLKSDQGEVAVIEGYQSKLAVQSKPTQPMACQVELATQWAKLSQVQTSGDDYGLTLVSDEMLSIRSSNQSYEELGGVSFDVWSDRYESWFEQEFPETKRLQVLFAQNGVESDLLDVVVESGGGQRFAWPAYSEKQFLIEDYEALHAIATTVGLDVDFSSVSGRMQPKIGLEAYKQWKEDFLAASEFEQVDIRLILDSIHAANYLANTRSLLWYAIGQGSVSHVYPEGAQLLLSQQVDVTHEMVQSLVDMLVARRKMDCSMDEYLRLRENIVQGIDALIRNERELVKKNNSHL